MDSLETFDNDSICRKNNTCDRDHCIVQNAFCLVKKHDLYACKCHGKSCYNNRLLFFCLSFAVFFFR